MPRRAERAPWGPPCTAACAIRPGQPERCVMADGPPRLSSGMTPVSTASALAGLSGPGADVLWTTLVERHGPDVWRLIASRSHSTHDAEDAYQEFWMHLPRAAHGFRPPPGDDERSSRAWLMRVAYTSAIDHGRRRRPVASPAIAPVGRSSAVDDPDPDTRTPGSGPLAGDLAGDLAARAGQRPGSEELDDRRLLMARVQAAITTLPESYRRPLLLHLVAGLSYDDLAADLRCTVNHARVKVHRGIKRLRALLGVDEQRLPERTLAGMMVPLLAMPMAPTLPPFAPPPFTPPPGALHHGAKLVLKAATFLASAAAISTVLVVGAHAARPAPAPAAVLVAPAPPETIEVMLADFSGPLLGMQGHGHLGMLPRLALVPAPAGGGHGSALRIAWGADHQRWVDTSCTPARSPIRELAAPYSGVVTAAVWSDGIGDVEHIGVRFSDAAHIIFEYRRPLPERTATGWQTMTFPLSLLVPAHWENGPGTVGERAPVYPLTFVGFGIQLSDRTPKRAGSVIIDDVLLTLNR
jgi:RNA polymerase sigma factor (sigma-70 family)